MIIQYILFFKKTNWYYNDDINDTGKTFDFVKKHSIIQMRDTFCSIDKCVTSKTKIDYHGQLIDKSESLFGMFFHGKIGGKF